MSFISNLAGLDAVDKKDIEAVNNGGLTSQSDGTLNYYIDMDTFRRIGVFYDIGGSGVCTMTIHASNDEVASGSATYLDVTLQLFGSATYTADVFAWSQEEIVCKWIRIMIEISGGETDNAVNVVARKGY